MKHIIIGTAGHIDHGKSTLIKALTGRETDQLKEEKARGISINLGFTYFDLPNGDRVGIIDVPGHERFIKNMLSGAAGIDLVLLAIAADEGVMPQTVEHLDILEYMQIKKGIIVLTKADTVDEDMIELAKMDIRERLSRSFLAEAPIVVVDSLSRRGLDELTDMITTMSDGLEEKDPNAPARLNIDRVFSLKGYGTIVTGTLMEGTLTDKTPLFVYPGEQSAKIRNIQVHDVDVDTAYAGQRTAINLANLKVSDLKRGDILAAPYSLEESRMIDVRLKMSPYTSFELEHWDRLRLFHGAREIFCRAVPLDRESLKAGESGFVQLRLEEPIYCKKGDVFVVRNYSPMITIGGGTIVDTVSKKHNLHNEEVLSRLKIKERGELIDILSEYIRQNSSFYPDKNEILSYSGENPDLVAETLTRLSERGDIILLADRSIHKDYLAVLTERLDKSLSHYHQKHHLQKGCPKEELRHQIDPNINTKVFNALLNRWVNDGHLRQQDALIALSSFKPRLTPEEQKLRKSILSQIDKAGYNLLSIEQFDAKKEKPMIIHLLDHELMLIGEALISKALFEEAKKIVREYIVMHGKITLAEFRDLTSSSRKNALIILDELDRRKWTKREGEARILA